MKVSLVEARKLAGKDLPSRDIDELVQKIGAQLGAVEEVVDFGNRYDGIVVAKVVSCVKHENADKLSVCLIDDGGVKQDIERNQDGLIQVVCGAPNVREGLTVAWIPPGATVPSTIDKDPFVLGSRELRGVMSNGMIASASELSISDDHSGILEIDENEVGSELAKPGTEFKKLYGLDDVVLDIENKMFTHRPDCFGVLGVVREIFGIYGQEFKSPDWYWKLPEFQQASGLKLEIKNEIPELVPRFMAVAMDNVDIKPSPIWMQALLTRIGVKPINNVVDLTNYLSYVTAQPMHAYDYDKVANLTDGEGAVLMARYPLEGEKVALLNGKTIEPREEAIMIATDKELVGVGGIMGGTSTEVDDSTRRIIIECANFDMYSIRKTSMAHGLFTDAVTRFNKGQSVLQNDRVIAKMVEMVQQLSGGKQAGDVIDNRHIDKDIYDRQAVHAGVKTTVEFINSRLGMNLAKEEIMNTLRNVNFACLDESADGELEVNAPFWRTDIELAEDVVEEVGRLIGFDKLPKDLPKRTMSPAVIEDDLIYKKQIREILASFGANEVLTYSFVHEKLLKSAGQDPGQAFKLSNALSPELQYYRMTLTPSLLNHVHHNIKSGSDEFALFEINKTHIKVHANDDNGVPKELKMVSMVFASKNQKQAGYFTARAYLDQLASKLGIGLDYEKIDQEFDYQVTKPFEPSRSALVKIKGTDEILGIVGEYKMGVVSKFKLPNACAGFEVGLDQIISFSKNKGSDYAPLSTYPSISQDICLEVDKNMPFGELDNKFDDVLGQVCADKVTADYSLIDIYSGEKIPDKKRITYRIKFTNYDHTMQEEFVNNIMNDIAQNMQKDIGANRI